MSRGNGGEVLFRRDDDRRAFLGLMSEFPKRFGVEVHAFVLMGNRCLNAISCGYFPGASCRAAATTRPGVRCQ